jgi:hypothetical protein
LNLNDDLHWHCDFLEASTDRERQALRLAGDGMASI